MHVLHLIDSPDRPPCPMRLAAVADISAALSVPRQSVVLIGRVELEDIAARVGLPVSDRLGAGGSVARTLRRWLSGRGVDAICAWSASAMTLAQNAAGTIPLICPDPQAPAMDFDRLRDADRVALRRRWGAEEDDCVVALVGRTVYDCDAALGGWVVGLVDQTPRTARLLIPPGGYGRRRLERMFAMSGQSRSLIVDPPAAQPWRVLAGCDVALSVDSSANYGGVDLTVQPVLRIPTGGGMGLAWAMAAGLAVVVEDAAATRLHVRHESNGLVADPSPRRMAQAVCRLIDDPALRQRLGRSAALDAQQRHAAQTAADRLTGQMPTLEDSSGAAAPT